MTPQRRYVGIIETGEILGCSVKTVRRMIADGRLRTVIIGEQPKVTMASIDRLDPDSKTKSA